MANNPSDPSGRPKLGLNEAGLGITTGDWQIGVIPVTGTDSRYDSPQNREQAERREEDARAAKAHGEHTPNPLVDLIHSYMAGPTAPASSDPLMDGIRTQIAEAEAKHKKDQAG